MKSLTLALVMCLLSACGGTSEEASRSSILPVDCGGGISCK